jgi:uncharacterized protein YecT (DUF1311 family)
MTRVRRIALLLAGLAAAPALAATDCDNATTQAAMNQCAAADAKAADAALNAAYGKAMKGLAPPLQTKLRAAQRAWIGYRDAHCGFVSAGGGSVAPMVRSSCVAEVTKARTKEIESATQCPEGDVACPR